MSNTKQKYTTDSVTSKDGTTIGYRQMGNGQGVILLHGGINASQHLMKLGTLLSDAFTVYIPDRRGRGLSGPIGEDYGIEREDEDLDALLKKQGRTMSLEQRTVHYLHCMLQSLIWLSGRLLLMSRSFILANQNWIY